MHLDRQQKVAIAWALFPVVFIWQINGIYMAALARISVPLFWLADVIQWIVLPAVLLIFLAKRAALLPKDYGLDTAALRWRSLILGTLAVFATTSLAYFWASKLSWQWLDQPTGYFSFPEVFPGGLMGNVIWFYSALTAGIVESIFFIGLPWLLYRNVRRLPSRAAFTLIASVIFACAHWEQGPHVVVAAFCFHVVACAWYFRLGTLWPVAASHSLVDMVAFA
jgi:membrane protease YdiL (CAAX protease family)